MIPFNKPYLTGKELNNISIAHQRGQLAGDGSFTQLCSQWLKEKTGSHAALLTHSCTAALEMSAILAGVGPGDEVIMPSYTFVSTANAFVLRGAVPVFVDIRRDTLNLDERLVEEAITDKTRALVPVHYAGVACEMDTLLEVSRNKQLLVIEDAAQGVMASYRGRPLGGIGDLGCFSFHETKNVISGEGGALLVNRESMVARSEVVREKGTNRSQFFRGQVDKYTWVDIGSSFLPGEIVAAFLYAQLEEAEAITRKRMEVWEKYHSGLELLEKRGIVRRPVVPQHCQHNAHMYYLLVESLDVRTRLLEFLAGRGVAAVFHYVPLHSAPAGKRYARTSGDLSVTEDVSVRLVRLPIWPEMEQAPLVIEALYDFFAA